MPEVKDSLRLIHFGPFELDLSSQELRKSGIRLHLPRQSFQILKMLLERPGELVSRDELRTSLWPSDTFVDFEHGLNAAINRLRETLGDNADNPRYVETLPRRGYRFIDTLTQPDPLQITLRTDEVREEECPAKRRSKRTLRLLLGAVVVCALVLAGFLRRESPTPRVTAYRQLTKDGLPKGQNLCSWRDNVVTDGPRVFFSEPISSVMQVSSSGGDALKVPTPFPCFRIFDISPDKTELLGASGRADGFDQPLWVLSVAGGLARRMGDLNGHAGTWSPNGLNIAYATGDDPYGGSDLYIAASDGSNARKVVGFEKAYIYSVRWSLDGKILRMNVSGQLWEVRPDGTNLHRLALFPEGNLGHRIGTRGTGTQIGWSPDGRYFVFGAANSIWDGGQIWAFRETRSFLGKKAPRVFQLTSGAMQFWNATPSLDGKQIFAIGGQRRGELVRYDLQSKRLERYLSGISVDQLDFSRDGQWVVYVTYPEGILWRSKTDGSERMQLVGTPFRVATPRWSPDRTRIAFAGLLPGGHWQIYVVPAEGGEPHLFAPSERDQLDPTWSPDGDSLIFGVGAYYPNPQISSVDLRTGRVTIIPGSEGLWSPRLSPDGRFIVAFDAPSQLKLFLLDQKTQKRSELFERQTADMGWLSWTRDSKFVYVFVGVTDAVDKLSVVLYRIHIADRDVRQVAVFQLPRGMTGNWYSWLGIAPDGSPMSLEDLNVQEIYALDVDLP